MKKFYCYFVLLLGLFPFVSCTKNNSEAASDKQSVVKAPSLKVEFQAALNEVRALQTTKQEEIKARLKKAGVSEKDIELALNEFKQPLAKTEKALDEIADILAKKYGEDKLFKDLPEQEVDALVKEYLQKELADDFASTAYISGEGGRKAIDISSHTTTQLSAQECEKLLSDTDNGAVKIALYLLCRATPGKN